MKSLKVVSGELEKLTIGEARGQLSAYETGIVTFKIGPMKMRNMSLSTCPYHELFTLVEISVFHILHTTSMTV